MRGEGQGVTCGHCLRVIVVNLITVVLTISMTLGLQRAWPELWLALREDIQVDQTRVLQTGMLVVLAQQVIVELELRRDTIGLLLTPSQVSNGNRVTQVTNLAQLQ